MTPAIEQSSYALKARRGCSAFWAGCCAVCVSWLIPRQGMWHVHLNKCMALVQKICTSPRVWLAPLAVLAILLVIVEVAMWQGGHMRTDAKKAFTALLMEDALTALNSAFLLMLRPAVALATMVLSSPNIGALNANWMHRTATIVSVSAREAGGGC